MITKSKRQWLVCAYAEPKRMAGYCDKFAKPVRDEALSGFKSQVQKPSDGA
jgi:hypothetical protein